MANTIKLIGVLFVDGKFIVAKPQQAAEVKHFINADAVSMDTYTTHIDISGDKPMLSTGKGKYPLLYNNGDIHTLISMKSIPGINVKVSLKKLVGTLTYA